MLHVAGVGFAAPEFSIDSALLLQLGERSTLAEECGIRSRRSVLTPEYLRAHGGRDLREAPKHSLYSPTDLGVRALGAALQVAGIPWERLGLIVGECGSPLETIPSEAHRIAKRLGGKTLSYDLFSSSAGLSLALSSLLDWKDERLPEYIAIVSTNTPTQRVDYSAGLARAILSDGAGALILSPLHKPGHRIDRAYYSTRCDSLDSAGFDLFEPARIEQAAFEIAEGRLVETIQAAQSAIKGRPARWVLSSLTPALVDRAATRCGLDPAVVECGEREFGYMMGSSLYPLLLTALERERTGTVVAVQAGLNGVAGFVVFEGAV